MKFLFTILLLSFEFSSISQTPLPDNFKIGNFIEVFSTDSIRVYFNCTGAVVDKKCASYYRVGKMDSTIISVSGNFYDYNINGKIFLRAFMLNNKLEGIAHYYHENGNISEEGNYRNNIRQGKWTFYYPNGNVKKVYNYTDGEPLVLEAYDANGKPIVINGYGNFKTEFSLNKQCGIFEASGQLINGKKNGEWSFSYPNASRPTVTEIYAEGKFVKGNSNNDVYTDNPKIGVSNFYANESLDLLDNSLGCPGDFFTFWRYDNKDIFSSFYPELQEKLTQYNSAIKNQWLIIGIRIEKKNKIDEIKVASSVNDNNIENYVYSIVSKMTRWKTAVVNSRKIESNIFLQF